MTIEALKRVRRRYVQTNVNGPDFDRFEEMAARKGMNRSQLLRSLVIAALEQELAAKPPEPAALPFILQPIMAKRETAQ